jgi:predicted acylesterase/phospholipase RssA
VSNLSNCRLIRTYRGPSAEHNFTIIEAIQAATALPGWFPPVKTGPAHSKEWMAGGATCYNNPTKQALEEAKRVFGPDHKASIILSLGSGHRHPQSLHNGVKEGLQHVLDDLAQSGEQTAEELSQRFDNSTFYNRFSVDPGLEKVSITGWTEDELGTITSHTKVYTQKVFSSISTVAELLLKNEGCVTLGQLSRSSKLSQNYAHSSQHRSR